MIHLLNGATEVRVRSSEEVTVLLCGCAHTPTRWLQMCDADYQPDHALHLQAQAEHVARSQQP